MTRVFVSGAFDDARSRHLRFLYEASRLGPVTVVLWPDEAVAGLAGAPPRFSLEERLYYAQSLRYVDAVVVADPGLDPDALPAGLVDADAPPGRRGTWLVAEGLAHGPLAALEGPGPAKEAFCSARGLGYRAIGSSELRGFPDVAPPPPPKPAGVTRVVVTGCFDWLHTGHIRFFEEASAYGELTVVIGSDANLRLLKGEGHPLFPEAERRFVAASIRTVERCLVATGSGWLDAEPEMLSLQADRYLVNEDGDKPEKRRFCEARGIEYVILKREPKRGLPSRSSTDLKS